MKKCIIAIILCLLVVSVAMAGTIKPNGINQKDLYNLLSKMVTMQNQLKSQHNVLANKIAGEATYANYSATVRGSVVSTTDLSLTQ